MNFYMETDLYNFLAQHADLKKTLLLGLSGGEDSTALFHLLLALKKKNNLDFAVAHIDHGWRKTSAAEAAKLEKMALQVGVPFHLLTLDPKELKGNLELACRLKRLDFFKKLVAKFSYEAVILGHHLDDQAETVLKRIFEGASLPHLEALKKVTRIDDLIILRPLLDIRKRKIQAYLKLLGVEAFQDSTNKDPKFMRARLRTSIIPHLVQEFGKDIVGPLQRLSLMAKELKNYLNDQFDYHKPNIIKGLCGTYFDFSTIKSDFEIKYLMKMCTESEGLSLTYPLVETGLSLIQTNAANKSIEICKKRIVFDRKKMFILSDFISESHKGCSYPPIDSLEIDTSNLGTFYFGQWEIILQKAESAEHLSSWQNVFKGKVRVPLLSGKYFFKSAKSEGIYPILSTLWTKHKVPAFLRHLMPVLVKDNEIYEEFLTGKRTEIKDETLEFFTLIIQKR